MRTRKISNSRSETKTSFALLLVDVINDFDFPQAPKLLRYALPAARTIARLKKRAQAAHIPVIYINDNFGRWQSDFRHQVEHCQQDQCRGREIAALLAPDEKDYFVLKPKHSGFYSTSLGVLLDHLGTKTLVLTGFAANICVLYTANDAYMRDYRLIIARDAVASETRETNSQALAQMKRCLHAELRLSRDIRFS